VTSRFALFVKKMKTDTLWERLYVLLSEEKKEEWAKRYKKRFGVEFIPPKQIESLEEMKQIMEEAPPYVLDVQGREG